MSMGLRYQYGFYSYSNVLYEVSIYQEEYSGDVIPIEFGSESLTIEWHETDKLEPVQSSVATLCLFSNTDRQFVDLYTVNKRYLSSESFTKPTATNEQLYFAKRPADEQILQDTAMNYRVLDVPLFEDAMPSFYHKSVGGYHAAKLTRYQDLMTYQMDFRNNRVNFDVLNMLNTKYIITSDTEVSLNPEALGNAWLVDTVDYVETPRQEMDYLNDFNPATQAVADRRFQAALGTDVPVKAPGDTIYETTYAPNRLTYHASTRNGGVAVFSEVYFPWGWEATIDGKPAEIGRVNYVLRALRIPAGSHTIDFSFEPQSVTVTETLAYISIILIYMAAVAAAAMGILKYRKQWAN